MSFERHPDDLPPPEGLPPNRSRLPRGFGWALALALVVLVVASFVALDTDPDADGRAIDLRQALNAPPGSAQLGGRDPSGEVLPDTALVRFDDGAPTTLAEFRGVPVVVNFFASFCIPCRTEMPAFEQVHQRIGERVRVVGIDTGEPIEAGRRIAAETGVTYPLLSDPQGATMVALGATVLPTTVLADAQGTVIAVHNGALTADQLERWVAEELPGAVPA